MGVTLNGNAVEYLTADCSVQEYQALCEVNHAKNCVLPDGQYDGTVSTTVSGMLAFHIIFISR